MNTDEKVLIIDDEPDLRELLLLTLKRMGIEADAASCVTEGKAFIANNKYFLILTDMRLTDGNGMELVQYVQKNKMQTPIAVITAFGSIEDAVQVLKAGAFDYVSKPINLVMLKSLVKTALDLNKSIPKDIDKVLVGNSSPMQKLKTNINKLALNQAPVFIYGESGVGKELVARMIHANGPRSENAFVAVNCGAIPSELMESEFFGHKKGSFTGAYVDKVGLFEAANGGTLFLDEIADLPLLMQVKLLRAIQEKAVKPIGGTEEIAVDVRILSASNKDLLAEIESGNFRQELYYRINVIELQVPPLRQRLEDLPLLVENILQKLAQNHNKNIPKFSKEAMQALQGYHFVGNVRELENILERAIVLCSNDLVTAQDLEFSNNKTPVIKTLSPMTLEAQMLEYERELILQALEANQGNKTSTAKALGISFRTLRYRLQKLNL